MPLMVPYRPGFADREASTATTSSAGTTITAHATTHTKGSTPTQLIASTVRDSYGIFVLLDNTAVGNTVTSMLLDIMTGAGGSEVVLIPDLACGYALAEGSSNVPACYWFPLFIPSGTRISARCQAAITVDTVNCRIALFGTPTGFGGWVGTRVTAYGVTSASSTGTNVTCGNNAYGTAAQLSSSTANPIRAMQFGLQGGGDGSLTDYRCLLEARIGTTNPIPGASGVFASTDTGTESVSVATGNMRMAQQGFNLPAGIDLRVSGMVNGTTNNVLDVIAYGVD